MIRELNDYEVKALHHELLLKDILATADKLPPFPDVVWKVMPLIRRMAPVQEIEAVIRYDQAITAKILSLSQSTYYSRRHRVSSLQDAIILLGSQQLIQVIMIACAARFFQSNVSGYNLKERELWEHSVATALMAEIIARRLKHRKTMTVYTASLLHDIGKTVLDLYARLYLHTSLSETKKRGLELIDAERSALGIDHQELGETIARRWRFPPDVIVAIGHHHHPEKATSCQDVVATVYAADKMVNAFSAEKEGGGEPFNSGEDQVFVKLGISKENAGAMLIELEASLEGIQKFLSSAP